VEVIGGDRSQFLVTRLQLDKERKMIVLPEGFYPASSFSGI